jgi:tetratricopeptide (TPR) repeat protein
MTTGPKIIPKEFKEDKVYLTMAEVVDFVVRYRSAVALAVLAVIAAFGLVYYMYNRSERLAREASWALYEAGFIEGSSEKIDALKIVAAEYGGTQAGRFASFELANSFYSSGNYGEALEAFQSFLNKNPKHLLAPSAEESIGYCQESLGLWNDAIQTYEKMIKDNPTGPAAARSNYRLGHCYEKRNDKEKAIEFYEKVTELAPEGLWNYYAKQRLESLDPEEYAAIEAEPQFPPGMRMPFATPPSPPPSAPVE